MIIDENKWQQKKYNEIGSEFHSMPLEDGNGLIYPCNGSLVFSGRTAIETILQNLPNAKKALLPSYCCDSMIRPFRKSGIDCSFYDVNYKNGELKIDLDISSCHNNVEILLWCNYFGFKIPMPDLRAFLDRGVIIIEDITHSLFSTHPYHQQSYYLVASLRKWEPVICGGYCAATTKILNHVPRKSPPEFFTKNKMRAMQLKAEYLETHDDVKKKQYLNLFSESNQWLANNYSELSIDTESSFFLSNVDIDKQRSIRRQNAHILYEGLKGKVNFLFPEKDMDCPLFVPILLQNRDEVRTVLIQNKIYCPVHWPKPEGCKSNLYDIELSLICDQRYSKTDMERIISVLEHTR